ncbi:MAG: ATP-dependent RNA helicase DbpA [Syntrophus sp. SKADARSKE-3]|nr:ATP-dependent RNA helicase DbpA [Syntrophus sp. SKADARSKE-3]
MNSPDRKDILTSFHPLLATWFTRRLGVPTDIQARAWPKIIKGSHALITAPTGSGKTLAAFLWAINQLVTGAWSTGQTRVLYVSPLKALNNDIRRNLLEPLEEMKNCFREAGVPFPEIGVVTRSGDTPADERRQMLRRPPEILITTPESINILLSSRSGRTMLTGIATVILDEIHAVVGTKRGTHLITAVERLVRLSGEFQRLTLSATVKPLETVADFVGGFIQKGSAETGFYEKRPVEIIRGSQIKRSAIEVRFPPDAREQLVDASWWPVLINSFRDIIKENRSTLFFTNSRRTAEKVTRLINEEEPTELAYSHHGSLSREIRMAVEERLKNGELRAIVATSSLELGIDIGELDRVVLIETPLSVSSAIQRIGRSGHKVGGTSRGLLYPTHGHDFLTAAVIAKSITDQDIEAICPIDCPLDILAQVLLSMVGMEKWDIDELYAFIRTAYPYRDLSRRQFDLVLSMLEGRYADTRLRELRPRISLDRIDNTIHGKDGVLRLVYLSGGTIADRGYYDLRLQDSHAKIGELDEEFVWERRIGDTFTLGAQVWRILKVTHNDVEVVPSDGKPGIFPFWKAEDQNRDFHFSEKILTFLEAYSGRLDDPALKGELIRDYFMDGTAADELIGYLKRQREATGTDLPHRHHLLVEHFTDPLNTSGAKQVILHTLWGGRVNRPFSLALQAAWEEKFKTHLEIFQNNDCILLMLPDGFSTNDILTLVTPENVERHLRQSLEKSGFFGARFRENAGRALLLPRLSFKKRLPLWLNRLRAKKLMDAVLAYPDFPLLLETWRTCLQDEFDLTNLKILLDEVRGGRINLTEITTEAPSPFADGLIWRQTNTYMYEDDSPISGKISRLSRELLQEVLFSTRLRPRIPAHLVENLEGKLQRVAVGYAPRTSTDLLDWTKERLLIPLTEWQVLLDAVARDHKITVEEALHPVAGKLASILLPGASIRMICAAENLGRITKAFHSLPGEMDIQTFSHPGSSQMIRKAGKGKFANLYGEYEEPSLSDAFQQWLSFYGPVKKSSLSEILGLDKSALDELLADLVESQEVILDLLTENTGEPEVCDRENMEILLRMARKSRQPSFHALALERLPLFLAAWQGLTAPGETLDDLQKRLDQLFGYPAHVEAWEKNILPARIKPYYTAWLDRLMQTGDLVWFGCGNRKITFSFADDLELFPDRGGRKGSKLLPGPGLPQELAHLFPQSIGRFNLMDLVQFSKLDSRTMTERLWTLAWQGRVTNDAFSTLRQGVLTDFTPFEPQRERRRPSRTAYNRWSATRPLTGNWYPIAGDSMDKDPVDEAELAKDRVRQLFRRYGILFRELLAWEMPSLQWVGVFKALRLMELSGEIISGYFFEDIPGLQFISHEAFRFLCDPLPEDAVYWMNAADPASFAGIHLDALKKNLPSRIPSTHLVFRGWRLQIISRRNGNDLNIFAPPDDPRLSEYLSLFKVHLSREFSPEKIITVERINGRPARESAYASALSEFGFTKYHKGLEMTARY